MTRSADNFPPDPAWFLIGAGLLFAAQVAVHVGLALAIARG